MAGPIVHITNGIPDLGTGNITTLGQTLLDGANGTLGMTTDVAVAAGAAGTINAHLRSISRDIASGIVLQAGGATIGNVGQSGAPWSQNVTQFGGSAVVTGTGIGGAGIPRVTVSSDSSLAATQSGNWDIRNITGSVPLPTGASTSAKQPSLGTAGVPSADVITVQGISGGVALKVDGTGGSFPVSGTVAATQSGTWNITNISGTVSLPTGAATSANQPTNATLGSTTSGQTGTLALGAVTTAAPTYVTAQTNALSLTTAGALRVDGSGSTQPVSGTVTVTQATAANLNATVTGTVTANQGGTWNINNISGTVSLPTGAATSANQPTAAAIGSTTSGQTGNLAMGAVTTAAPSYTTGQTNNLSLTTTGLLRVDGSGATQPVSGTVSV